MAPPGKASTVIPSPSLRSLTVACPNCVATDIPGAKMMLAAFASAEIGPRKPAPRPLPKLNKFIMPASSPAEDSVADEGGPGDRSEEACLAVAALGPTLGEETTLAEGAGDKEGPGR